jgi:hypothetical protein
MTIASEVVYVEKASNPEVPFSTKISELEKKGP